MDEPATKRDVWFVATCILSALSSGDNSYWFAVFWLAFAAVLGLPWLISKVRND